MKRMILLVLQLCSLILLVCHCTAAEQTQTTYDYKGFDTNGTLAVEGVLRISGDISNTNKVEGNWSLHEVKPNKVMRLGPQTGSGKLAGSVNGTMISLNLNPGWADNNVILSGNMTPTNFVGTWGYYGFPGKMDGGKFEAMKK